MTKRMLPIGMTSLRKIRGEMDCYYVDKTDHVRRLVEGGQYYFLSRPRRFGKTLLVDTLQELFEGSEELFRGLAVHGKWDWSARHPVVRLDFSGVGRFDGPDGVRETVEAQLEETEMQAGLEPGPAGAAVRFRRLIRTLHERTGQRTVVLVDEYDKPILDALGDRELALANRDFLRSLYGVIKTCDRQLRFVFLTGVSKFSQAGLFSGLNNLNDITLAPEFSSICGCTDAELDAAFAPELEGLDRDEIRRWYNGYNWRGPERVYNPFGLLLLFQRREFRPYWFQSGTPTFLVETLARRDLPTPDLDGMIGSESLLSTFDVDNISVEALLFQTGYLTIAGEEDGHYRLDYPNLEVRRSLGEALLEELLPVEARKKTGRLRLGELLEANDFERIGTLFRGIFAAIPHQWYMNSPVAKYEAHYASVIHSCFLMEGLEPVAEDSGSRGRADMAVRASGRVYLFEFKVVERGREGVALAQLREKGYADKYRRLGRSVHLIGVEFSREERNVVGFDCEAA